MKGVDEGEFEGGFDNGECAEPEGLVGLVALVALVALGCG